MTRILTNERRKWYLRCRGAVHCVPALVLLVLLCLRVVVHAQDFPPPLEGEVVAYTDSGGRSVHLYDTGTNLTRHMTLGAGTHHVWDFSPDGCRVLVTLTPPGGGASRLVSARLDGSDVRDMLDTSELVPLAAWSAWDADWSPDGSRIVFALSRPVEKNTRESRIAWTPGEGGTPTFYSVAGDEHSPRWSPDGNWLAYTSYDERPAGRIISATAEPTPAANAPLLREADIWIVSANGLAKERITRFEVGSANRPRWSPDSTLLGFVYAPSPGDHQLWMIAAVPDALPTQLSYAWHQSLDLTWLPDGTAMVAALRDFQNVDESRLWSIPLTGNADTDAELLFSAAGASALAGIPGDFPRFSSSGEWLALRSVYRLVIVTLADGNAVTLAGFGNTPPVWTPPGFNGEATCDR